MMLAVSKAAADVFSNGVVDNALEWANSLALAVAWAKTIKDAELRDSLAAELTQ